MVRQWRLYRLEKCFKHNVPIHNTQNYMLTCGNTDGADTDSVCPASYKGSHNPLETKSITKIAIEKVTYSKMKISLCLLLFEREVNLCILHFIFISFGAQDEKTERVCVLSFMQ